MTIEGYSAVHEGNTDNYVPKWFTGTAITGTGSSISAVIANSKAGDMYLNTSTDNVYKSSSANIWDYVCNIKGNTGATGATGATGPQGPQGPAGTSGSYLPLSGGSISGNVVIYTTGTGNTPFIEFRRGSNSDDYTDWRIYDSGGFLYFSWKSIEHNWPTRLYFDGGGQVNASGFVNSSDERLKNHIEDVDLQIDKIANAPIFKFTWIPTDLDKKIHVGTSAQYWKEILPDIISTQNNEEGFLSMPYDVAALVSAVSVARELLELRSRVEKLEGKN